MNPSLPLATNPVTLTETQPVRLAVRLTLVKEPSMFLKDPSMFLKDCLRMVAAKREREQPMLSVTCDLMAHR